MAVRRFGLLLAALVLWGAPGGSVRAFDYNVGWGQVVPYWQAANEILLTLAKNNALDEEWLEEVKALERPDATGKTVADYQALAASLREKIDVMAQAGNLKPTEVHPPDLGIDGTPAAAFMDAGFVLDNMVRYVITIDPVWIAGQYYPPFADVEGSLGDAYGELALADTRMQMFIDQIGF